MGAYSKSEQSYHLFVQASSTSNNKNTEPTVTVTNSSSTTVNSLDGTIRPDWRSRIRLLKPATTSLSAIKRSGVKGDASQGCAYWITDSRANPGNYRMRGANGNLLGAFVLPGDPFGLDTSEALSVASGKFWSDANAARRSLQSGALLGEIGQTFRMVRSNWVKMMGSLTSWNRALQRSKRYMKTKSHRLKEASDRWLEFQFGVNPLVKDINAGLNAFIEPRREARRVSGTGRTKASSQSESNESPFGCLLRRQVVKLDSEVSYRFLGAVMAETEANSVMGNRLGLLPSDFIPTLYELMPWSFLLDYASNIGSMVESICAPRSSLAWVQGTSRKVNRRTATLVARVDPAVPTRRIEWTELTPCSQVTEFIRVDRAGLSADAVGTPDFRFRIPGYTRQWMNLSALVAAQKFRYWP